MPYFSFDEWKAALKSGSERGYTLKVVEMMRSVRDLEALRLINETLRGLGSHGTIPAGGGTGHSNTWG